MISILIITKKRCEEQDKEGYDLLFETDENLSTKKNDFSNHKGDDVGEIDHTSHQRREDIQQNENHETENTKEGTDDQKKKPENVSTEERHSSKYGRHKKDADCEFEHISIQSKDEFPQHVNHEADNTKEGKNEDKMEDTSHLMSEELLIMQAYEIEDDTLTIDIFKEYGDHIRVTIKANGEEIIETTGNTPEEEVVEEVNFLLKELHLKAETVINEKCPK